MATLNDEERKKKGKRKKKGRPRGAGNETQANTKKNTANLDEGG